jgi:hypothetical protein
MLALINAQGHCLHYDRLENDPVQLDHYFSQIQDCKRKGFEIVKTIYLAGWLLVGRANPASQRDRLVSLF